MEIQQEAIGCRRGAQRSAGLLQRAREADAIAQLLEVRAQHEPDVRLIINHQEVPCRDGQRRTGLKQTSDGCAVSTQVEQEGAHVRRGLHSTMRRASAWSTATTARPPPNSSTALVKSPRPPASPSCAMCLIAVGSRAATLSASTPLATRESMGRPSRPTTTTASTPVERLSASTTSRMVAIRAAT